MRITITELKPVKTSIELPHGYAVMHGETLWALFTAPAHPASPGHQMSREKAMEEAEAYVKGQSDAVLRIVEYTA